MLGSITLCKSASRLLQFPKTVEETKCLYVDDLDKLKILMDHIEMQQELAIDLEVGAVL